MATPPGSQGKVGGWCDNESVGCTLPSRIHRAEQWWLEQGRWPIPQPIFTKSTELVCTTYNKHTSWHGQTASNISELEFIWRIFCLSSEGAAMSCSSDFSRPWSSSGMKFRPKISPPHSFPCQERSYYLQLYDLFRLTADIESEGFPWLTLLFLKFESHIWSWEP